jgi:diguanylate cyclase (GGDEF)-like protein
MSIVGRRDRVLLAGLAAAGIVVFARPLRYLIDLATDVERSSGLALIPALIILTVVFIIHQQGKSQEVRVEAAAAEAAAQEAQDRALELEQLVRFGEALGRTLDTDTIRDVVMQQLPKLTGAVGVEDVWVLVREGGHWDALGGAMRDQRDLDQRRVKIADCAIVVDGPWAAGKALSADGHLCIPLIAGGHTVGVLGLAQQANQMTAARQRVLATAATLLAISIRNAQLFRELRDNSLRDGLTCCFNRTHALAVIDTELRRARRSQTPVSLILFDLDHFKDVNDRHGHLCGDAVLAAVGNKMRDVLRGSDVKCRFGGEEFLVLLPETPLEGAKRVADTLRRELAEIRIDWKGEIVTTTGSFGVAIARPSEIDKEALISRADDAMYRAKDQGRNCVRLSVESAVA